MPSPCLRRPSYADATAARRGLAVALEQLDVAGEELDLEQLLGDAELLDGAPRRRDHPPRGVDAAAQRLEHRLTPERDGLDRRRALRDAQHAHDVEAAAARARDGARAEQRRDRRAREHAVRAAPVARAPRGGQRAIERGLRLADLAEPRERGRVHGVGLGLAGDVADRGQRRRRGGRPPRPSRAAPADR